MKSMLKKFFCCCCSTPHYIGMADQTFVVIHGDVISRGLVGQVISELEKHFSIVGVKMIQFDSNTIDKLYAGAKYEPFYSSLQEYMTTGSHIALVVQGENAVERMLELKGKDPETDEEGTLRKQFGINIGISSIHCSHDRPSAIREICLFFKPEEINSNIPAIEEYMAISPHP